MNRLSHRIDRQAAQNGKIEEFIAQNPNILAEPFKNFAAAWNSIQLFSTLSFVLFDFL